MRRHVPLWLKGLVSAVIAAHLLLIAAAILNVARDIPSADEWTKRMNASVAIKTAQGKLALADLFASYNSHRSPFTLSLTALNTAIFHYDPRFEMLITAVLLAANFGLLAQIVHRQLGPKTPRLFWLSLIPLAGMVFTGRWLVGWLWGLVNLWQLGILFTLIGILTADRMQLGWRLAMLLALLCTLASFSNSAGVLAFGVVGLIWWLRGERHLLRLAFFVSVAVFCFTVIFLVDQHNPMQVTLDPFLNAYFTALYLGAVQLSPPALRYNVLPVFSEGVAVSLFGVGCLFTAINLRYLLRRMPLTRVALSAGLVLWGMGFALVTSIGRYQEYAEAALHIDYHTPMVMLLWIGAFMLSLLVIQTARGMLRTVNQLFILWILGMQTVFTLFALAYIALPPLRIDQHIIQLRECALTVLIGNNVGCGALRAEEAYENALGLAANRLASFRAASEQPVPLMLHFLPVLYPSTHFIEDEENVRILMLDGQAQYVLFQGTERLLQSPALPDLPDYRFTLRGALMAQPACAEQSIKARLIVDDGQTQRIAIERVATTDLVPFSLDLTELRGRSFSLLYELDISEPLTCGHILWADPRIEFSLPPQAQ
ncbi:MAG: hypothetical protein SNJ58_05275 [Aggregatilineales bacterium]